MWNSIGNKFNKGKFIQDDTERIRKTMVIERTKRN